MKQKVTIKVGMECDCCRNKAMKIASMIKGVTAVAIEGDSKDLVVVTGDDVDAVCLGKNLRKKFRIVTVLTVEEVKPKKEPEKPKKEPEKPKPKEEPKVVTVCVVPPAHPCVRCCSPKCSGGCKPCCKCHSHKCDGKCEQCGKCGSHKCEGGCKACSRCGSYSCHGHCAPAVICYGQCPPWRLCPSCYTTPPYAPCYTFVCDQKPADSCSIQ
ncbi:hypothetical protein QN277_007423 [Acacia crassicarpa]|uniref:HMA domain-containing protein n=1 Tax=Acacia crassicarpa TaxID=499986 RepID=A0AAE1IUT6_9FABA|nr:hypothetical protein QN277_007423 [Acacia crassicarpa]